MSDDLVERIASAILETPSNDSLDQARAALEAITAAGYVVVPREPSEKMLFDGACVGGFDGEWQEDNTSRIWEAMIDAAESKKAAVTP